MGFSHLKKGEGARDKCWVVLIERQPWTLLAKPDSYLGTAYGCWNWKHLPIEAEVTVGPMEGRHKGHYTLDLPRMPTNWLQNACVY